MNISDIDLALSLGGLVAGLMVGLTGMGGAALVTPMLVLMFGISPAAAVSSDVVAAAVMKPIGAAVHIRSKTVHWPLVGWLSLGSIPGVLIGTLIFAQVLSTYGADETIRSWIGVVLIIALCAMLLKSYLTARRSKLHGEQELLGTSMPVKVLPTIILGLVVGLVVGDDQRGFGFPDGDGAPPHVPAAKAFGVGRNRPHPSSSDAHRRGNSARRSWRHRHRRRDFPPPWPDPRCLCRRSSILSLRRIEPSLPTYGGARLNGNQIAGRTQLGCWFHRNRRRFCHWRDDCP